MKRSRWVSAYLLTATVGLGAAYGFSLLLFSSTAHSQTPKAEAPSDGSLPAEFLNQIEGGAPAPETAAPPPPPAGTAAPPATAEPASPPATPPPAASPAPEPPAPEPPPAAPAPEAAPPPVSGTAVPPEEYVYDGAGRRDPFKPYRTIRTQPTAASAPKPEEMLEPLQRYDLEQITVLAILWDVSQPRALVKDGDGKTHTLVKNTKIGRSNGYVAAIREGEIVVIESVDEEGGRTVKRTRLLEFKKQQGRD